MEKIKGIIHLNFQVHETLGKKNWLGLIFKATSEKMTKTTFGLKLHIQGLLTLWGTSFHAVLLVKAIGTVFTPIAKLARRNAKGSWRTGTEYRWAAAGRHGRSRRFVTRWHFVWWISVWFGWRHDLFCDILKIQQKSLWSSTGTCQILYYIATNLTGKASFIIWKEN